jgi:hypothetical protein
MTGVENMTARLTLTLLLGSLLAVAAGGPAVGDDQQKADKYIRIRVGENKRPVALETAIIRFEGKDAAHAGLAVDLVGAIHIADKAYYDKLNRRFKKYDAVLYELVAPEEANVPTPGQSSGGVIGGLQGGMKSLLDLEHQLDWIDYGARNMVHADMSPEEFSETMKRRKESFAGMFFRLLGRALAEQSEDPLGTSDWQMLAALFAPDRAHQLKLLMAEEFSDLEGQIGVFDGPEGSTIITERNGKALEVLSREIQGGKKKIAIFYGAGHLADLQRRLESEFRMKPVKTLWITAWSLDGGDGT